MISPQDRSVLLNSFPSQLRPDVETVCNTWPSDDPLRNMEPIPLIWRGEKLLIPYRIYCRSIPRPDRAASDTDVIRATFLTRHDDGHVREACLRLILDSGKPWILPYVMLLIGEYVLPILTEIDTRFSELDPQEIRRFLIENPKFLESTRSRVASYWDCYYREHSKATYAGFRLIEKIEQVI